MMAAGDSISDAEEENEDESRRSTTPQTLRRNSHVNIISLSPPSANTTWSLVSIKDNHEEEDSSSLIFPPSNHENLHLSPPSPPPPPALDFKHHAKSFMLPPLSLSSSSSEIVDEDESNDDSSTSTLFSPSTGPDSPPITRARKTAGVVRWGNLGMELLYSKVKTLLSFGSHHIPAFTAAAMVVGFLYFWWRRQLGRMEQRDRDRLFGIIREKDERINQLLNQIARMNDMLMALQRLPASSK